MKNININDKNNDISSIEKKRRLRKDNNYSDYRIQNQASQILNYSHNVYFDKDNLVDVIRIFNNILDDTNADFKDSLNNTLKIFKTENLLEYDKIISEANENRLLENNNVNSFLIFPMFSNNHAFYGVLRKIDDKYSYTAVNRGSRASYKQYEEYIIADDKVSDFLKFLKSVGVENNNITTYSIYIGISEFIENRYTLNIDSLPQKVGNCFIKELETAIKYAYWTRNENIQELREGNIKKHPKWNEPTKDVHHKYIQFLKEENIDQQEVLEELYNRYSINKDIRDSVKDNKLSINTINEAFRQRENSISEFLNILDMYNFQKMKEDIQKIVDEYGNPTEKEAFQKIRTLYSNLQDRYTYKLYTNENFEGISKCFTNLSKQLKEEYATMYYNEAANEYKRGDSDESLRLLKGTLELVPNYAYAYTLKADIEGDLRKYDDAIKDIDKAISLQPHMLLNYTKKSKFSKLKGDFDEYLKACEKIIELDVTNKDLCVEVCDECYIRGKYNKALEWLKKAQDIDGDSKNSILLNSLEKKLLSKIKSNDRTIF